MSDTAGVCGQLGFELLFQEVPLLHHCGIFPFTMLSNISLLSVQKLSRRSSSPQSNSSIFCFFSASEVALTTSLISIFSNLAFSFHVFLFTTSSAVSLFTLFHIVYGRFSHFLIIK